MTTTPDRWIEGEAVRHSKHGEGRVRHVEASGIAYASTSAAAYIPMGTITAEYAANGWKRDTQERLPLFRSSMAAASTAGAWS